MTDKIISTTIEILGKTYQIKCPDSEVDALQKAAGYLEEKMQQVRHSGITQMDKIAVIAALNVAYQLLNFDSIKQDAMQNINQRLQDLQTKVEEALVPNVQSELLTAE